MSVLAFDLRRDRRGAERVALELKAGQERFRARNNVFWNGGGYVGSEDDFRNLLDFNTTVPDDVTVTTEAWDGTGGTCSICQGAPFDDTIAGWAVRVEKDVDPNTAEQTTVVTTHETDILILLNEGE